MRGSGLHLSSRLVVLALVTPYAPLVQAVEHEPVSSKVLYQAVDQLTSYLNADLADLAKHTRKTAIVNYTQSEELPTSLQHYVIKRLERLAANTDASPVRIVQCMECTSIQAVAEGDEVFIRKGITDDAQLKAVMGDLGIRKYSDVNLAYTGDELVLQVSVADEAKMVDWSKEYSTPYKAYADSPWVLGVGAEVGSFSGGGLSLPAAMGARAHVGQRLPGVGAAGLAGTFFKSSPGMPRIAGLGAFFSLSHNELFNQYWNFVRLSYQLELGATDFNGTQLFHETLGVKTVLGKHYSIGLNVTTHQFVQTPEDDAPIHNPEGEPLMNNNDALPMMASLVLGVEFL